MAHGLREVELAQVQMTAVEIKTPHREDRGRMKSAQLEPSFTMRGGFWASNVNSSPTEDAISASPDGGVVIK